MSTWTDAVSCRGIAVSGRDQLRELPAQDELRERPMLNAPFRTGQYVA